MLPEESPKKPIVSLKLFPEIPSYLELDILEYCGYCPICEQFVDHNLVACCECSGILCLDYLGGIFTLGKYNLNNFICKKCRSIKITTITPITFYHNKSTNLKIKDT
jgi:hypothetical protein